MMSDLDQLRAEKSKKEMDDDDGLRVEGLIEEDPRQTTGRPGGGPGSLYSSSCPLTTM